jgi:hypothetical protein
MEVNVLHKKLNKASRKQMYIMQQAIGPVCNMEGKNIV